MVHRWSNIRRRRSQRGRLLPTLCCRNKTSPQTRRLRPHLCITSSSSTTGSPTAATILTVPVTAQTQHHPQHQHLRQMARSGAAQLPMAPPTRPPPMGVPVASSIRSAACITATSPSLLSARIRYPTLRSTQVGPLPTAVHRRACRRHRRPRRLPS